MPNYDPPHQEFCMLSDLKRVIDQALQKGDCPIKLDDPDTGWHLAIGVVKILSDGEKGPFYLITGSYTGDPEGQIFPKGETTK